MPSLFINRPGLEGGAPTPWLTDEIKQRYFNVNGPTEAELAQRNQTARDAATGTPAEIQRAAMDMVAKGQQGTPSNLTAQNEGKIWAQTWQSGSTNDENPTAFDAATARPVSGWFFPWEVVDQKGQPVYKPEDAAWQQSRQARVNYEANKLTYQQAQDAKLAEQGQHDFMANQTLGNLQAAGAQVRPLSLGDADVRQMLYDNRNNATGLLGHAAQAAGAGYFVAPSKADVNWPSDFGKPNIANRVGKTWVGSSFGLPGEAPSQDTTIMNPGRDVPGAPVDRSLWARYPGDQTDTQGTGFPGHQVGGNLKLASRGPRLTGGY